MTTNQPFTPTPNDMEAVHYGIPVSTYGEDGNMLALGHHDHRKTFAAFNKHARTFLGFANFADDRQAHLDDWIDEIHHTWLTFHRPDLEGDWTWEGRPATADTPDAIPVSILDIA
ncbi:MULTISPECIES: hypothetical protein [unclassified Streptomyces]|uniref:hypothetical protein n=1 Tax=unclassified Streptomyces TaxID=2593676 RepID=UPI001F34A33B|nr:MULTISPECIES: hypothetical protein [unclassified Streptomyces]MCF0086648.1 hypothetical protein [Streptomyces sp. MH192]MCF0098802.1 hypothetical protein [Streptomyces sp. MH191]